MSRDRLAALTGVAFLVFLIVGGVIGGEPPSADDDVQEIISHYADNKDSIYVGTLVGGIGLVLLIFFGAYLRKVLSAAEGPDGMLSVLPLVGVSIVGLGFAIDATILVALAEAVDDIEPSAVQALQALWDNDFVPFLLGTLVFLISSGLAILLHGGLPKWLGWVALVLAVIGFTPIGFVSFLGSGLWIATASVILAARAPGPAPG